MSIIRKNNKQRELEKRGLPNWIEIGTETEDKMIQCSGSSVPVGAGCRMKR